MQYRREIDGLRALAVLPVIFFHAGFEIFRGGFVGVDVFFVISGYLITSLIYQELQGGKFSFANFYERRARRILPALYFVLAVTVPFAWLWLQPNDLKDYFESLATVSVFSSNILFWMESGYFDSAAELKPLLHTWSLAVEEQYYLIIPVLMYVLWRNKKSFATTFAVIFVISLLAAEWASSNQPSAGFFLLPFRAWELLIGAFCALYLSSNRSKAFSTNLLQGGSAAGLLLILLSIFSFSKSTPFPGLYALIPTLGSALIILFAKPPTIVGKVLSSRYLVGIGLISYSAYLWHQPIFALARHRSLGEPTAQLFAVLSLLSIVLAYFSWRAVERPFRQKGFISKSNIYAFSLVGLVAFLSVGFFSPSQINNEARTELAWLDGSGIPSKPRGVTLDGVDCSGRDPAKACQLTNGDYDDTLVVIGDSHARGLTQSVELALKDYRVKLIDLSSSGCPFLPGLNVYNNEVIFNNCDAEFQRKRLSYLKSLQPSTVILLSRLPMYINGEGFNNQVGGKEKPVSFYASTSPNPSVEQGAIAERSVKIRTAFFESVESMRAMGHKVVIVGPVPPTGWDPMARLYRIDRLGVASSHEDRAELMKVPYSTIHEWDKLAVGIVDDIVEKYPDVTYVNPDELFCADGYCASITQDSILYADASHLSLAGNKILFAEIMKKYREKSKLLTEARN